MTVSQWAEKNRRLSPEASAEPGIWRNTKTPHLVEPMDEICNPNRHRVVLMFCAQIGKTELLLNAMGYYIDYDPCPMLILQPTLEMAEAFSKDRLAPMARDTPALQGKIKDPRSRDSGNTLLHKNFPGGHATLAGANSPSSLASRPIRVNFCDEIDRYPESAGTEGDPVLLARKRTTTFTWNWKQVVVSTPTLKGRSRIEKEWEESDQRRRYVPCTECGEYQVLKFPQLVWENDDPATTRYRCEYCGQFMNEAKKTWMFKEGVAEWRATFPGRPVAGFHLNELYSPWRRWALIVEDFLEARKKPEMLKTWVNTALGETWEEKGDAPEWERLYERREPYAKNAVPQDAVLLTAGVDVQANRLEFEIVAWARDRQTWSIDYRVIVGDTATEAPWKELDRVLDEEWPHASGLTMRLSALAVDTGFNTQHVYKWVRKKPADRVFAVKGKDDYPSILGRPNHVDVKSDGKVLKRGLRLWPVGTNIAKGELYGWLKQSRNEDGSYPYGFCHFPEYDAEYFKMLTAEQLVRRVVKNRSVYGWEKFRERNEAMDCRVYARAAAHGIQMDRFSDAKWDELARPFIEAITPASKVSEPKPESKPRSTRRPSHWDLIKR